jgi:hypothetical protein
MTQETLKRMKMLDDKIIYTFNTSMPALMYVLMYVGQQTPSKSSSTNQLLANIYMLRYNIICAPEGKFGLNFISLRCNQHVHLFDSIF